MGMTNIEYFVHRDGAYNLVGAIDFNTAPFWFNASKELFAGLSNQTVTLNFSALELTTSSAGLALVIEWLKLAEKYHVTLRFAEFPSALLSIAKVSGVVDLIQPCL